MHVEALEILGVRDRTLVSIDVDDCVNKNNI